MAEEKGINEMLSSILENGELMEKISGIVKESGSGEDSLARVVEAIRDSKNTDKSESDEAASKESIINDRGEGREKPVFKEKIREGVSHFNTKSSKESAALLRAMKPFLSKERCDMVDNILKLEQLASIVKLTR